MISKEINQKLYEIGFPFREGSTRCYPNPVLSELIEECGSPIHIHSKKHNQWFVTDGNVHTKYEGHGESIEEAVANFYIAINKK